MRLKKTVNIDEFADKIKTDTQFNNQTSAIIAKRAFALAEPEDLTIHHNKRNGGTAITVIFKLYQAPLYERLKGK